ncbi:MAG: toll/interleukin-1 receptor domain-containing protein [Chryseobacterium sp.]|jgi:hypothetical protein|uniref:toll/interleukin-1 receptor domain-containing protein n=1 Tax=Chryseobacterium sp. TaxID=1871047 RepID=UPI00282909BF|nr:toll/interleukin-1 receptor domain-containing protein [Chryseobacterium sp.]MDR2234696.1 toll/interleukin-1 receptor domain-containing protein [Chryseobacterium sp.]
MKYNAFISYSHSDCSAIAPAIQYAIENIGKPWYKLKRNLNVFRDETNLGANPHFWENIENALNNSDNFVLLASPKTSQSVWITKEIEKWITLNPSLDRFFIVKTAGNLEWDKKSNLDFDWKKTDCLPYILRGKFYKEPLYIDLSAYINKSNYKTPGFTYKIVKIISGITGIAPREIESEEKKRRQRVIIALAIGILTFIAVSFLGYMFYQQKEINEKNAIVNNLIAEGNKYRETNIEKALLLYSYAYSMSNDSSSYKVLNDFYNSHTTYELNTFKESFNLFHSRKILERRQDNLDIKYVLDSLKLLNTSSHLSQVTNDNTFYFETNINTQVNNLKKQNESEEILLYCKGGRYNFVLFKEFLYIFLGKMNEGDGDYYLDYVETEPLFKLQLLYNDNARDNIVKMGDTHNWEEKFVGIYSDENSGKLYILAKKEPWINPNSTEVHYELFTFNFFNRARITKNQTQIIGEIIKNYGQIDLSNEEKINLGLINKNHFIINK